MGREEEAKCTEPKYLECLCKVTPNTGGMLAGFAFFFVHCMSYFVKLGQCETFLIN